MVNEIEIPQWIQVVYWLADKIGKVAICKVEVKVTKWGAFSYTAPKNFAYVRESESGAAIKIDTKKEWAQKAGVGDTVDRETDNGWWGEPDVTWFIKADDKERLAQMAGILAKIQKARHR